MLKDTKIFSIQIIRHCGQSGFSLKKIIYTYIYIHIYTCVYIYIHTHTHIPIQIDVYIKSICINLAGYSPWGRKELDTTEHMHARARAHTQTHTHKNKYF